MMVAIERIPWPPTPQSIISVFIIYDLRIYDLRFFLCGLLLLQVALESLHTLTTGNDDTHTVVVDLIADGLCDLGHILRNGVYHLQMILREAEALTDRLKLIRAGRILTARHRRRQVVGDDHGDIRILVDAHSR